MQDSVTVHMDANPEAVWALVSDVTQIGRYSPETFEAEWLDGATGPAVGARFRGHVKRNGIGPVYWTTCSVTECEPGRAFTFGVGAPGKAMNTWSYRIEPTAGAGPTSPSRSGSARCCRCASTGPSSVGRAAVPTARACAPRWSGSRPRSRRADASRAGRGRDAAPTSRSGRCVRCDRPGRRRVRLSWVGGAGTALRSEELPCQVLRPVLIRRGGLSSLTGVSSQSCHRTARRGRLTTIRPRRRFGNPERVCPSGPRCSVREQRVELFVAHADAVLCAAGVDDSGRQCAACARSISHQRKFRVWVRIWSRCCAYGTCPSPGHVSRNASRCASLAVCTVLTAHW